MARLRIVKKEVTLIAEGRGHALFLWRKHPVRVNGFAEAVPPSFETICARCDEKFSVEGVREPYVAGPINQACSAKGGR